MKINETKRETYQKLLGQLMTERATFEAHWRDLSSYILPRRTRFFVQDVNKGDRRNQNIIDSTATLAARTLASGMMAGVTSPARPWFRLTTPDPELAESYEIKNWLSVVEDRMSTVFLRSNLYNSLPGVYGDMGVFGIGAILIEEDFERVIHTRVFPVGSYWIANDKQGRVRVFYRKFQMTVRQLIEDFGEREQNNGKITWDNFSTQVRQMWEQNQLELWVEVAHVIAPNADYDESSPFARDKMYTSCYFETGSSQAGAYHSSGDDGKFLRESGYEYFPVLCPRWQVNGEDVYPTDCPGMTCLGDQRALQLMHKRLAQAIEKKVNPPMVANAALKGTATTVLPGGITFAAPMANQGMKPFEPTYQVNFDVTELQEYIREHQQRIDEAFFVNLFLALTSDLRNQPPTAREIEERHEEKLSMLGPVLEQLNQELLDPLIDIVFAIMMRQGLIPDPPEDLKGVALRVEYISIMAQAQKAAGSGTLERFFGMVANMAQGAPSVINKVKIDKAVEVYADMMGVPPSIIRTEDEIAEIEAGQERQAQAAQILERVQQGAAAAKDLAQADMSSDNALTRLVKQSQAGQLVST